METIEKRGMPNYFGEQRFGRRDNNDQLGAALIRGDNMGLLKLLLGSPDPKVDDSGSLEARRKFEAHENEAADARLAAAMRDGAADSGPTDEDAPPRRRRPGDR